MPTTYYTRQRPARSPSTSWSARRPSTRPARRYALSSSVWQPATSTADDLQEPLGRAFTRGHVLPPQTLEAGFQFGVTSQKGDDVRTSLYPAAAEPAPAPTFYRKSAGESSNSVDGGSVDRIRQQRRRDDWRKMAIDPGSYRFGAPPLPPTATPSSNAADLLAPKRPLLIGMRRREDHKAAHQHVVGRAKQPP